MRADRLLSILLLLQTRGKLTAESLSKELEVSIRTIYRDMDALSIAGFPLYAEKGTGGGFALLEDFDLSIKGLNTRDIQALSAIAIPKPLEEIGLGMALRTALLKILERLDQPSNGEQAWLQKRFILDTTYPIKTQKPTRNLPLIQKAVWENKCVAFRAQYPIHSGRSNTITVAPLTLIAAGGKWFLIGARKDFQRVYPLTSLLDVAILEETFIHPKDFDPKAFWRKWCALKETRKMNFEVLALVRQDLIPTLSWTIDPDPKSAEGITRKPGWREVKLGFDDLNQARTELLGFGGSVMVLSPLALRLSILDYAKQIQAAYV